MNLSHDVHRETSDVSVGGVGVFVIVLVVATVVICGAVWAFYRYLGEQAARPAPTEFPLATNAMRRLPPEPRLQTDPRDDLAALRHSEDEILQSYAWVDRNAGVVLKISKDRLATLTPASK